MPQFECEQVGPKRFSGLVRGRTPEDAIRRIVGLDVEVALEPEDGYEGWQIVKLDNQPNGRIRKHQRMQFRRD